MAEFYYIPYPPKPGDNEFQYHRVTGSLSGLANQQYLTDLDAVITQWNNLAKLANFALTATQWRGKTPNQDTQTLEFFPNQYWIQTWNNFSLALGRGDIGQAAQLASKLRQEIELVVDRIAELANFAFVVGLSGLKISGALDDQIIFEKWMNAATQPDSE